MPGDCPLDAKRTPQATDGDATAALNSADGAICANAQRMRDSSHSQENLHAQAGEQG
jgi:hypothetical protein